MSRDYEEKRDFIRMRVDTPIELHLSETGTTVTGICRDLSGSGLLVETSDEVALGTEVEIKLLSHYGHSPRLHGWGRVVRQQTYPNGKIALGISLDKLAE